MKRAYHITTLALATTLGGSLLFAPLAARASEDGHRNTAIGLGALAAGLLLTQKNKLPGLLAAGGAAYAYTQYQRDVHNRHQREDWYGYNDYNRNRGHNNDGYNGDGYDYRHHNDGNYGDGDYRDNGYQYRDQNDDGDDYDTPRPNRSYHRQNGSAFSHNRGSRHGR